LTGLHSLLDKYFGLFKTMITRFDIGHEFERRLSGIAQLYGLAML